MKYVLNVKRLTSAIFFVFVTICCFAQNYSLKETKKGAVFYQRLEWDSTGVVTQYKVIVEQKLNDKYVQIEEYITKNTFQDVSLDAGQYRFKVIFYNVFGQAAHETKYQSFEILAAHQPEISSKKKIDAINLDEQQEQVCIYVEVSDINASAQFSLINAKTGETVVAKPEKVEINDSLASVYFNKKDLTAGKYKVVVKNPGGLKAESVSFSIQNRDPVYFDVSLCNNSVLFQGDKYLPAVFNKQFVPFGLNCSAGIYFNLSKNNALGFELTSSINGLQNTSGKTLLLAKLIHTGLNVSYEQMCLKSNLGEFCFGGYAGTGASIIQCGVTTEETKSIVSVLPYANAGIYTKYIFSNGLYLKAGTELFYVPQVFDADYNIVSMNFLIGGGYRF